MLMKHFVNSLIFSSLYVNMTYNINVLIQRTTRHEIVPLTSMTDPIKQKSDFLKKSQKTFRRDGYCL